MQLLNKQIKQKLFKHIMAIQNVFGCFPSGAHKMYYDLKIIFATLFCLAWTTLQYSPMANLECNRTTYVPEEQDCCLTANIYTEELIEKCGDFIEGSYTNIDFRSTLFENCFVNCILNETKILEANGELNEEAMLTYVNNVFADTPDMIPIVEESFRICFHTTDSIRKFNPPGIDCPLGNALIMDCLYMRIFMFCVETSWSDDDICNDAREYTDKCYPKLLYTGQE